MKILIYLPVCLALSSLIYFQVVRGEDAFNPPPLAQLVPPDKHLDPAWVKSLTERGEPHICSGDELKYIGMPIGGLFAGQLYIGGDGQLWHWDVFNDSLFTGWSGHYMPMPVTKPLEQNFSLAIDGKDTPLDATAFSNLTFRGEYPMAFVTYQDPKVPVKVNLTAFSPFIPLNTDDSSLPLTVLEYSIENTGDHPVIVALKGTLENFVLNRERGALKGTRVNKVTTSGPVSLLEETVEAEDDQSKTEDNGSMGLALLDSPADLESGDQRVPAAQKLVGTLGRTITLKPGESQQLTFLVAWYFPNLHHIPDVAEQGRWYASKFGSVSDVVRYFVQNQDRLVGDTKKWHKTWYDSSLPYWFLDRTMIPTDNLATSSNYRFKNGRWWAYEGVGSCNGTCGHVYGYAQAIARLFPDIERDQRERIDFGTSLTPEGWIDCRGESKGGPAIDAQGFYILRALREHQMTTDNAFLTRIWPGVKKAMEYMIRQDPGEKGVIEGAQHNTLDADWYGEVSWYNGIYLAALRATAKMADIMGENDYAAHCRKLAESGEAYMTSHLFNGEYFQNKVDPAHLDAINSGSGSEIDQVLGQSWAFQVGLPRVLPQKETVSSLQSLWKYNFAPDVGPYRAANKSGRTYAVSGEAGLLMCTFPRPDWDFVKASGQARGQDGTMITGYFNECMTGFEHQVAGHMLWEGMATEGLAIERAIDDRYAPAKRNPYNEVECGDHYGRAMAAYGVFLAACGFEYDGPTGSIAFAPRISPENFKAAFTAAEGWGSYSQKMTTGSMLSTLEVKWGKLRLRTISLEPAFEPTSGRITVGATEVPGSLKRQDGHTVITLSSDVTLTSGQSLEVTLK